MLTTEVIPSELIFEEIDGRPLFYKGYKRVLEGKKEPESIMGSSFIQSLIVSIVCAYLKEILTGFPYWVVSNEVGLHISDGNNLANDIAVFDKGAIIDVFSENYVSVAPRMQLKLI
ncbi:hypothetical protein [Dyadobacter sp. CY356]|uniref:hypothetical protein n=1 Tax=Dyadobacter sp. CY356 TaxID=2906442 RepID=UPI001F1C9163|nr:hypothetical protein [Dyadobacter sp. CY356]MCF0054464.1 hypothetical protein [Dyadobacter sp. CY356]